MNISAFHFLTHDDDVPLPQGTDPAALTDCVARLSDEDRYALRRYWNQLIWDEFIPLSERVERVPSFAELDERRAQRRMRRDIASATEPKRDSQFGEVGIAPGAA